VSPLRQDIALLSSAVKTRGDASAYGDEGLPLPHAAVPMAMRLLAMLAQCAVRATPGLSYSEYGAF
jgi:hypothetical protein